MVTERRKPAVEDTYIVFLEGKEVYRGTKPVTSDCCATHDAEYRYALLKTGDFQETADIDPENGMMTLTDDTLAVQLAGNLYIDEDETFFLADTAVAKKTITDDRERRLYCNGTSIGGRKQYDGLYCCGEFLLCTYLEDEYLSGWKDEGFLQIDLGNDTTWSTRKWSPNPGWGDASPPPASNRAAWDYYRAVYPGFAVDVFCKGAYVGTYRLSDGNSPIHYDRLGIGKVWLLFMCHLTQGGRNDIGIAPWALEGTPRCHDGKLLLPYDGGIRTCIGTATDRMVFV